jgi:glyoxylase-like metal-dependent hydrolase (beta-lactamase superfamily II)
VPPPIADLTRLAEDTYVWRYSGYNAIFIVTDDGVITTDPSSQFNPRAADLLKTVIRTVTDKPVKYVVYSHDHADHITGGSVFADTAQFVSQSRARDKIAARNDARTPVPQITFDDQMTLELGGKHVELYYTGRNHSDNSIVLVYPARRVAFAVDFIPVRSVLFRTLPDAYPEEWVDSLASVERNLQFDHLVPGHGPIGTKDNVREVREYLTSLMFWVRTARGEGLADNSPQMVERVKLALEPTYGSWDNFETQLPENIQGLIRIWASR